MFTLAALAGAFIALGGVAFTMVMTGADAGFSPARFLRGVVFSLGLLAGAAVGLPEFAANLLVVSVGNVVGGAGSVTLAYRLAYGPLG